jgi:two-component system CheB/CheR fusion protein
MSARGIYTGDESMDEQQTGRAPAPSGATKPTVEGIGASAGRLAALNRLFERMPSDTGLAFVVVAEHDSERSSRIATVSNLLSRSTGIGCCVRSPTGPAAP